MIKSSTLIETNSHVVRHGLKHGVLINKEPSELGLATLVMFIHVGSLHRLCSCL